MSQAAHPDLQRALQVTVEMIDAAVGGNWDRVNQLDRDRDRLLRKHRADPVTVHDRDTITALIAHNRTLMAHAEAAREAVRQRLDQHQYNHRALRTYIASSASR
jgi:hypothetical protein